MKFSEIPFERPSIESFEKGYDQLLKDFEQAETFERQDVLLKKLYEQREAFDTMHQLAFIKYTTDTSDEQMQKENDHFDTILPISEKMNTKYYNTLINSKFKEQLSNKWGAHLFNYASYKLKGFDPSIMEELKEENKLSSEYVKIKGTADIEFEGKKHNLAGIRKFIVDKDRSTREKASKARWDFFAQKQEQLDELFDKMVKLRHNMSLKLGLDNFVKLAYIRLGRIDYDDHMVSNFRDQIRKHIVPINAKLRKKQRKRLGYEILQDYDLDFMFTSGNPKPKGTPQEILMKAKQMYKELSDETNVFFEHMLKFDLLDVVNRPGKADMGYCWELSSYKHPFIFANFNGTRGDVDVLTHEAGHAFQYFCCRENNIIEYRTPGAETAEIHSMSMEFLTYPWMKNFFEEDEEKYFFSHMSDAFTFMPYGCAGDHFQQIVYENPGLTPNERAKAWKEMEKMYLPDRRMDSHPNLVNGRFWQRQGHFFENPFYFIDYVLAEVCALQFWQKNQQDSKQAWSDYLRLCKAGGSSTFLELLKVANLRSPFDDGCVKSVANEAFSHLNAIDDSSF